MHSGADGSLLGLLLGSAGGDGFGESIAPLGDVDGDGVPDFVVGSPGWHPSPRTHAPKGRLDILSGATLEPIRSYRGKRFGRTLGIRLTAMDPRDPLSGSFAHPEYRAGGRVGFTIRDARRRGGHRVFLEERNRVAFGLDMTGLGDVDGDGAPDLAVASRTVQSPDGTDGTTLVEVFSGARRRLVFAWQGVERDGDRLSLSRTGDLDGDGREELVVGIPNAEQALVFRLVDDSDPSLHVRTPR